MLLLWMKDFMQVTIHALLHVFFRLNIFCMFIGYDHQPHFLHSLK
jgi:hypothetical protein